MFFDLRSHTGGNEKGGIVLIFGLSLLESFGAVLED